MKADRATEAVVEVDLEAPERSLHQVPSVCSAFPGFQQETRLLLSSVVAEQRDRSVEQRHIMQSSGALAAADRATQGRHRRLAGRQCVAAGVEGTEVVPLTPQRSYSRKLAEHHDR